MRFVLLSVVVVSGCVQRPPVIEPIKIGVLVPLSGELSSQGPEEQQAAELAAEDVNAGGGVFDGRPLELLVEDTATDPSTAVAAAKKLLSEGAVGLVGPATSGESGPVLAQVAKPNSTPLISCCATAADLTANNPPNGGFFFRTTPSDKLQGKALAFIADNGLTGTVSEPKCPNATFAFRDDAYGSGFETVFQSEYQGNLFATKGYPHDGSLADLQSAADDLATTISTTIPDTAGQPELCLVVISFDTDGAPFIKELDAKLSTGRTNPLKYHFMVSDGANSDVFASGIGSDALAAKIIGTVPFHSTRPVYDEFVKAFDARYEITDEPIAFTAQTYDAVFLMALAITQGQSTTGVDIRNHLYPVSGATGGERFEGSFYGQIANAILAGKKVDYAGPSGEATFDAFGDVVGDYVIWQVKSDASGNFAIANQQPLLASTFNPN
jgi:ABC-type branched-subunit amino acid transport system substrate-binding protein